MEPSVDEILEGVGSDGVIDGDGGVGGDCEEEPEGITFSICCISPLFAGFSTISVVAGGFDVLVELEDVCPSVKVLEDTTEDADEDSDDSDGKKDMGGLAGLGGLVMISEDTGILVMNGSSVSVLLVSV